MEASGRNFEILELHLIKFGKFENYKIELSDGLNVIYGKNESGKSTIQLFIKAMLYGFNSRKINGSSLKERERAIPWKGNRAEGMMKISVDGRIMEIRRRFGKTTAGDKTEVCDGISGEVLDGYKDISVGEALLGIPSSVFEKTLWIRQGSISIEGKDDEISSRLMNIESSGDESMSADAALSYLANEKKSLKARDGRSSKGRIDELIERKEDCRRRRYELASQIIQTENIKNRLADARTEQTELEKTLARTEAEYKKSLEAKRLTAVRERFNKLKECDAKLKAAESDAEYIKAKDIEEKDVADSFEMQQRLNNIVNREIISDNIKEYEDKWLKEHTKAMMHKSVGAVISVILLITAIVLIVLGYTIAAIFSFVFAIASAFIILSGIKASGISKDIKSELDRERDRVSKQEKEQRDAEYNVRSEYNKLMLRFGVSDAAELQKLYNYKLRQETVIQSLREARLVYLENDTFEELMAIAESCNAEKLEEPEVVEAKLNEQRRRQMQLISEIKELEGKMAYEVKLDGLPSDIDTEIMAIDSEISECEHRLSVIEIAEKAIREASESFRASFAPALNKRAGKIVSALTDNEYTGIRVAEDYRMRVEAENELVNAEYFSFGTYEQLYFALRLAAGELICNNTPLFLDDILTVYDNERAVYAIRFLKEVSALRQVILFTCHEADREIAEQECAEIINLS